MVLFVILITGTLVVFGDNPATREDMAVAILLFPLFTIYYIVFVFIANLIMLISLLSFRDLKASLVNGRK